MNQAQGEKQQDELGWTTMAPAILGGAWIFFRPSDEAWYWRLVGAVILGFCLQAGAMVAIACCEHFVRNYGKRQKPDETVADNMFSPTTLGGAIVAIAVFAVMQYGRIERERDIERCLKPYGRGTFPAEAYRQCLTDLAPTDDSDE